MERGVIFTRSELIKIAGGQGFRIGKSINRLDINYFLLYWDRLVSPTNNMVFLGFPCEEELTRLGKLETPKFSIRDIRNMEGSYADFDALSQTRTLDLMRKKHKSTDWRIHSLNDELNFSDSDSVVKQTLRFDLCNLLPVPGTDVNLNEILEFKERRADELITLHSYIDELYFEVINSGDFELSKAKAFDGFKRAIADLDALNSQGWRSPIKFDISSSFEFDLNQVMTVATAGVAAMNSENPLAMLSVGAVASVLGGFIKVTPKMQSVLKEGNKNLSYLAKGKVEGVIAK
ncbi:DUF6236 family protein [Klebsiella pneumoniae]|uniref:DUF6236 family protein n=1 Tax=Klebsiella pneumoniae TaxID=573 RepID=UPI000E2DFD07|nr:DUF6236 family protein [Klebsiella pneumoniae]HCI5912090.1 hypothetical protein [Klebsiella quasipneumoniae subsp. similipneumoniae]MCI7866795.1 hypothetical protein [Klebsiella pneumoniae]MCO0650119.1 DUF6236 family protein [Klebsiella pneumoniae]MDK1849618.1 DUF6236 family protein [Klebsiella pneumoniae]WLE50593.1 DUF6236 family protein [Klebsiella pneumoniae]